MNPDTAAIDNSVDAWRFALLESSLDCVIVMDADGVIVDMNRDVEATFGFAREAIIGQRLADVFIPPDLREAHQRGFARYLATGQSTFLGTRVEVPALDSSGRRILVELSVVRLRGMRPALFVGRLRPIEAQKRRERRLRASAAASRALAGGGDSNTVTREVLKAIGQELGWPIVQYLGHLRGSPRDRGRACLAERRSQRSRFVLHRDVSETRRGASRQRLGFRRGDLARRRTDGDAPPSIP